MTTNIRRLIIFALPFLLLLIPAIGMLFTSEINWSVFDFFIAAAILFGTTLLIDFILKKTKSNRHRILLVASLIVLVLILWIELAVGLFGSPFAGS